MILVYGLYRKRSLLFGFHELVSIMRKSAEKNATDLSCPKCNDVDMEELTFPRSDLVIDRCPECRGLWFDNGELQEILRTNAGHRGVPPEREETDLACPRCGGRLFTFVYPPTDVTVDACEDCGGVWLDRGEFEQIREWHHSLTEKELAVLEGKEESTTQIMRQMLVDVETVTMPCPRCEKAALEEVPLDYSGVILDQCQNCRGIWFDGGELEQVLYMKEGPPDIPANATLSDRECPHCREQMASFNYPGTKVKVEMCPECHGLWFDAGEFQTVREHVEPKDQLKSPDKMFSGSAGKVSRFFRKVAQLLGA
ncbi:MAG: zf-TFIIB domain-containing protein [Candidatus Brocadiia bacterium]